MASSVVERRTLGPRPAALLVALILSFGASNGHGQTDPSPMPRAESGRRSFRPDPERRAFLTDSLAVLRRLVPAARQRREVLTRFEDMTREIARRLPTPELLRIGALPAIERITAIMDAWEEIRDRDDERFLANLGDQTLAAEIRTLPAVERRQRVRTLQLEQALHRTIAQALDRGLVSSEEAEDMRGVDPDEVVEKTFQLQKRIFLSVWASDLGPAEVTRLESLGIRRFWEDRAVLDRRLRGIFEPATIGKLRQLAESDRRDLMRRIRENDAPSRRLRELGLDPGALGALDDLDPESRARLTDELERIHLQGPPRGFGLPRRILDRLDPEERRNLAHLAPEALRALLQQRFPDEDWPRLERRFRDETRLAQVLEAIPQVLRPRLLKAAPEVARNILLRHFAADDPRLAETLELLRRRGRPALRLPVPRWLLARLGADEERRFRGLQAEARVDFLFERFADFYEAAVDRALRKSGAVRPDDWAARRGSERLKFLESKGIDLLDAIPLGPPPGAGRRR